MGFSTIRILGAFNVLMFVLSPHKVTISQGNFAQILCEHRSSLFSLYLVLFCLASTKIGRYFWEIYLKILSRTPLRFGDFSKEALNEHLRF